MKTRNFINPLQHFSTLPSDPVEIREAKQQGYLIFRTKDKPLAHEWLKHCQGLRHPCLRVRIGLKGAVLFLDMEPAKQKLDLKARRFLTGLGELTASPDVLCGATFFNCGKIPSEVAVKLADMLAELFRLGNVREPGAQAA